MNNTRTKAVFYVGYIMGDGGREAFRWTLKREPEPQDHEGRYIAVWGPFKTKRGAEFAASPATLGNPHTVMAGDCDRIAAEVAA